MPKRITPLSDVQLRNAKPKNKEFKLFDGGGLFLLVTPSGGKLWRFKFRFAGKEKKLSFGSYPEISLVEARRKRDEARQLVAQGINPSEERKTKKIAEKRETETFEVIAREYHSRFSSKWSPVTAAKNLRHLERDVFPWIGRCPIAEIKAPELLAVLRRVEDRGTIYTAHRLKSLCGMVFRYALASGRAERDPSSDLKGALTPFKEKHHAALIEPKDVAGLLRAIDGYAGSVVVKCALKLAPLLFCRPGELRKMQWAAINFETTEWRYLVTKTETEHCVPLSRQALTILKELQPLTGTSPYVFPSTRSLDRPMSNNTVNAALRRMGFDTKNEVTGHGFRAMARTILDEVLGFRPELIEHQLAHAVRDPLGRAYNRTTHLPERRKMMQAWSDYLDKLKENNTK